MSNHASSLRQPVAPADTAALARELAELLVQALNLELSAAEIDPDTPLYGEGLGLDSIDILEIALVVSKRYGVQLRGQRAGVGEKFRSAQRYTRAVRDYRISRRV